MHPLALARGLALDQRDQNALRQEDSRAQVRDRNPDSHRALARNAGDRHQAAHALGDLVDARAIAVRAGLAETRDAAVDDAWVEHTEGLVVDAQALFHARTIVLDHDVRGLREALEDRHALGISQVQRHAALVAVQILEIEAVTIATHPVARTPAGHLDLDGLRTPVDQLADAGGAGPGAREVEDFVAGQRQ